MTCERFMPSSRMRTIGSFGLAAGWLRPRVAGRKRRMAQAGRKAEGWRQIGVESLERLLFKNWFWKLLVRLPQGDPRADKL